MSKNQAAIVRTQYALDHHASAVKPAIDAFLYALAGSGLTYRFDSVRKGANSWFVDVTRSNITRRYYLHYIPGTVEVKNRPRSVKNLATMQSARDALRVVNAMAAGTL